MKNKSKRGEKVGENRGFGCVSVGRRGERKFEWSVCQFADKRGGASDNNASCIFNAPQASVAA